MGYPSCFDATQSIFIHVPKAAGISLSHTLYGTEVGHHTWRYYSKINPRKYRSYFKFAVMREPVSRFKSAFDYLKAGGRGGDNDRLFSQTVLQPFSNANELALAFRNIDLAAEIVFGDCPQFRPQAHFIADEHGEPQVDFLVRFDQLDQRFDQLASHVNPRVEKLPHLNRSKVKSPFIFEDPALEILSEVYAEDFSLWNRLCSQTSN